MSSILKMSKYGMDPEVTLGVDPDKMNGVLAGAAWFGVTGGEPEFRSRFQELPKPVPDEAMLPFWDGLGHSYKLIDVPVDSSQPSLEIGHLCGYDYTPERYKAEAERLTEYGFVCLRSKRGADGKYWETWKLHGYWAAKGDLAHYLEQPAIRDAAPADKLEHVTSWLCRYSSFGTLDVSWQVCAMTMD